MKRIAIVCVLTAVSFLLLAGMEKTDSGIPAFSVQVNVGPASTGAYELLRGPVPTQYTCDALVGKAGTNFLYAHPRLTVKPGQKRSMTATSGDLEVNFTVAVGASRNHASTEVVISRAGTVLHEQKSVIALEANR